MRWRTVVVRGYVPGCEAPPRLFTVDSTVQCPLRPGADCSGVGTSMSLSEPPVPQPQPQGQHRQVHWSGQLFFPTDPTSFGRWPTQMGLCFELGGCRYFFSLLYQIDVFPCPGSLLINTVNYSLFLCLHRHFSLEVASIVPILDLSPTVFSTSHLLPLMRESRPLFSPCFLTTTTGSFTNNRQANLA